jgi:hypothetical protein
MRGDERMVHRKLFHPQSDRKTQKFLNFIFRNRGGGDGGGDE